jgi:hypothetical protein
MKKFRKPLKFYITLLVISSILILAYTLYRLIFEEASFSEIYSIWFLPPFFVIIYYGSDFALDAIFNRKKKADYESKFLDAIGERMRKDQIFTIEDFRRLQINDKFQRSLSMAYQIYINGESEHYTIDNLKRKFDKNTIEERALKYVIVYLEENMDRDGKKDENKV